MHYLYRITNLINGKIYIGQAKDYNQRWRQHKLEAKRERPRMIVNIAMKKYGIDNFNYEVIATCKTLEDANDIETLLVKQYESHISLGKGYNVSAGGMNAPKTEAWKQMMRDYWADPEWRENIIQSITEAYAQRTPEEKEQTSKLLSELLTGRHLSPETEYQFGHLFNEETLQKMSEIKKGKHISPETEFKPGHQIKFDPTPEEKEDWINKLSETSKGKHYSPETEIKLGQHLSIETEFKPGQEPWNKGTHITNSGSFASGAQHKNAKLNETQVLEILKLNEQGTKKQNIADLFGVTKDNIYAILQGKSWSYITGIKKTK